MPIFNRFSSSVYKERRNELCERVKSEQQKEGVVVLFGNFEAESSAFKQDPSFIYYTGVEEPASALTIDLGSNETTLWVANFGKERAKWVAHTIEPSNKKADELGVDRIEYLGNPCVGYQCHPFFTHNQYAALLDHLKSRTQKNKKLYTLNPQSSYGYIEQRFILGRIFSLVPELRESIIDISLIVASMRRKKSKQEIEQIFNAIKITQDAQLTAAALIKPEKMEYEVQAAIQYTFTSQGAQIAFPSIIGSGKNSTILHYVENNKKIEEGDLVVVDIGAQFNYYCADITRTYPVGGVFTKRQKEIYIIVLECQDYIAKITKPGMWLSNREKPEQSLNHLAKKFVADKGYGDYFPHGIGHFLGLDVHDVGNYAEPLQVGDVITIEPGIYLPQKELGIRIEDDYWLLEDGVMCLSEDIPKGFDEMEELVRLQVMQEEQEEKKSESDA